MTVVRKRICVSVFTLLACLFFFACGIPVYYVIEPPQADSIPTYDTDEPSRRYFGFFCPYTSSSENSEFSLAGTEIYYRIYSSLEDMNADISNISRSNAEYSENGYRRMVELNYQALWSSTGDSPIVKKITSPRIIRVRLCTEGDYSAEIYDETNSTRISIPYRKGTGNTGSGNMSFDFTSGYHPEQNDLDTKANESSQNNGEWFINMYAVSVGRDSSLSQHYSSLLHMGNIKIRQRD